LKPPGLLECCLGQFLLTGLLIKPRQLKVNGAVIVARQAQHEFLDGLGIFSAIGIDAAQKGVNARHEICLGVKAELEVQFSDYLARRPLPDVTDELHRLRRAASDAMLAAGSAVEIEDTQLLRRQIARRCIYGLDVNPIAVEPARLALRIPATAPARRAYASRRYSIGWSQFSSRYSTTPTSDIDEGDQRPHRFFDRPEFVLLFKKRAYSLE
jgi:hypothetical protein